MPCSDSSTGCGCHPRELVHHLPEDAGSRLPPPSIFTSLFSLSKIVNPSFRNEIFSFRRINLFILTSIPFPPPLLALTYLLSRFTRGFMRFKCFCLQDYLCFIFDCFRVPIFFPFCGRKETRRRIKGEEWKWARNKAVNNIFNEKERTCNDGLARHGQLYLRVTFINSLSIFKRKDDTSPCHLDARTNETKSS